MDNDLLVKPANLTKAVNRNPITFVYENGLMGRQYLNKILCSFIIYPEIGSGYKDGSGRKTLDFIVQLERFNIN